ncbi:amidohydrolase family protein [Pedobacter cryophilus]|uniref:Amidohydrolase n=1 Tax=Pedobacter cryophilus TaxID=2571271 RepID=A0A4U1C6Z8_9SPHI|nr:amidohydrolase family protein [Pedobacter cryophilus]TKC00157.1 amidohydrolase [Pedobacter cryophilus]
MKKNLFLLISLSILLGSWAVPQKEKYDLLILNAKIIDVEKGTVSTSSFIAITKDTIRLVGDMTKLKGIKAIETLDAKNKFVMPALWDNHVHFRGGEALIQENKNLLPLFLAFGITTVREAGGDITPQVMQWRNQIKAGELVGPTIFTSGPKLDGSKPSWAGSIKVENEKDIEKALDSLQSIGVDFVKMYDGNLSKEAFYGIIKAAEKRGLKTTGHMPLSADILEGINYGLDGTEHLYYILKASSPKADSLTKLNLGYGMMGTLVETFDAELAQKVYQKMAQKNVFVTPTIYIGQVLANILKTDHSKDALLPYIGNGIIKSYQGRIDGAKRASANGGFLQTKTEKIFSEMVKPMYKAGVNILAGSDCGSNNSFVYPGESLHQELIHLVRVGLTPQEALKTSIINGPKFFNKGKIYGSVSKGKISDLLILDQNPLVAIQNIKTINGVVLRGKVYPKSVLNKMMEAVKK